MTARELVEKIATLLNVDPSFPSTQAQANMNAVERELEAALGEANKLYFGNHEHVGSVYVRCQDCLTFGTPMPGEYQCGNCNSNNTMSYLPPCCVKEAWSAARLAAYEDAAKIIDDTMYDPLCGDDCLREVANMIRQKAKEVGSIGGIKVKVDPAMKLGEWRIEKE